MCVCVCVCVRYKQANHFWTATMHHAWDVLWLKHDNTGPFKSMWNDISNKSLCLILHAYWTRLTYYIVCVFSAWRSVVNKESVTGVVHRMHPGDALVIMFVADVLVPKKAPGHLQKSARISANTMRNQMEHWCHMNQMGEHLWRYIHHTHWGRVTHTMRR